MSRERVPSHEDWLTLQQAADLLGVHQNTLRRWADAGRVSVYRTPGGHRRFRRDVIHSLRQESPSAPVSGGSKLGDSAEAAERSLQRSDRNGAATSQGAVQGAVVSRLIDDTLQHTRGALQQPTLRRQLWHHRSFSDAHIAARRESGRRLLGILLQLAAHPNASRQLLQRGREIAREYGREAYGMGLRSNELVRLWLTFRHIVVDSLAASRTDGTAQTDAYQLMHRISQFFDDLLVESLEAYEDALETSTGTPRRRLKEHPLHYGDEEHREA